ncbi:hypothetical protein [Clostridium sp.]|uniref:hypothetical protein n=1 Tax=Clostridium sp. TaxID=1506 RepID=UPI00284E479A|nr:hypothetical protein [Clostridium sp.]MDR3594279.1 hypothetical protein [Clostridium sp.]MDR3595990.1 hypothetical protein [Clostridium sp.]
MKATGGILFFIALILWIIAGTMETTVLTSGIESINNFGLMQKQMLLTIAGGVLFLSGVIYMGLGLIYDSFLQKLTSIDYKLREKEKIEKE